MLDDGYTRIANEILEKLTSFELSKRQLKIVLSVIRKTYGFNKKEDDITMSQVVKMTTLDKSAVSRTMAELFDMNVLSKRQGRYGQVIGLNKNINTWKELEKPNKVVKTTTVAKTTTDGCQNNNSELSKRQTQKTTPKDNSKRHTSFPPSEGAYKTKKGKFLEGELLKTFMQFWGAFDYKTGKAEAADVWIEIKPDSNTLQTILKAAKREAKRRPVLMSQGRTPKMAQGWLSGRRWEDEEDMLSPKKANGKLARAQQAMEEFYAEENDSGTTLQDAGKATGLLPGS